MRLSESKQPNRLISLALPLIALLACLIAVLTSTAASAGKLATTLPFQQNTAQSSALAQTKPLPAPASWRGLIGEYGPDDDILIILEKDEMPCASSNLAKPQPLRALSQTLS